MESPAGMRLDSALIYVPEELLWYFRIISSLLYIAAKIFPSEGLLFVLIITPHPRLILHRFMELSGAQVAIIPFLGQSILMGRLM